VLCPRFKDGPKEAGFALCVDEKVASHSRSSRHLVVDILEEGTTLLRESIYGCKKGFRLSRDLEGLGFLECREL
jgi:hypothetical protein